MNTSCVAACACQLKDGWQYRSCGWFLLLDCVWGAVISSLLLWMEIISQNKQWNHWNQKHDLKKKDGSDALLMSTPFHFSMTTCQDCVGFSHTSTQLYLNNLTMEKWFKLAGKFLIPIVWIGFQVSNTIWSRLSKNILSNVNCGTQKSQEFNMC